MAKWELRSYKGREIKTDEDIMWVCEEVTKAYERGDMTLQDKMALSFLGKLHQEHIDEGRFGFIENRFDILDL